MRAGGCECRHAQTRIHGGLGRHQVMATAGTNDVKRSIGFINWAHALDHYVMLIFPTVVIGLQVVYGRGYAERIALGTASFVCLGLFSLPAGWLADRWSRRRDQRRRVFERGGKRRRWLDFPPRYEYNL